MEACDRTCVINVEQLKIKIILMPRKNSVYFVKHSTKFILYPTLKFSAVVELIDTSF